MKTASSRAAWIAEIVREFWRDSPANTLGNGTGEKAWDCPELGFARGDDPLFSRFKAEIGPFFWTPVEAHRQAFPDLDLPASRLTVISWCLPQTEATRAEQRRERLYPAERWARSRDRGEAFNCALRRHLAAALSAAGFPATAPERSPLFAYRRSEKFGIAANWSERHVAFAAGLGTFGLSDGLITRRGKAVRFGSVVAAIGLEPTPRAYTGYRDWCLWFAHGTCRACEKRCPAGAIDASGHDKDRCRDYIRDVTAPYAREHYGAEATPCGLCQVRIPCEERIPAVVTGER